MFKDEKKREVAMVWNERFERILKIRNFFVSRIWGADMYVCMLAIGGKWWVPYYYCLRGFSCDAKEPSRG